MKLFPVVGDLFKNISHLLDYSSLNVGSLSGFSDEGHLQT